ncbi:hypothetical protein BKA69DRAFT_1123254 [Paraphysoderma sedebokerense]|nr:hypothetical protein BKA69DRAFT_1123254 [Paraphysoderma sedebokerense]
MSNTLPITCTQRSPFPVYNGTSTYGTDIIHFQVTYLLPATIIIWIGNQSGRMDNLSVGMKGRIESIPPSATALIGGTIDDEGKNLARKLATKYPTHQIFISYSLPTTDEMMTLFVEKTLRYMMKEIMDAQGNSALDKSSHNLPNQIGQGSQMKLENVGK